MEKELKEIENLESAGKDLTEKAFETQLKEQGFESIEKLVERIEHLKDKLGIAAEKAPEETKELSKL